MDSVSAFLSGNPHKETILEGAAGFCDPNKASPVCMLLKALYELNPAPRHWYSKIHYCLTTLLKVTSSPHKPYLYVFCDGRFFFILVFCVEDHPIAENHSPEIPRVRRVLCSSFKTVDLGAISDFLGTAITQIRVERVLISQAAYVHKKMNKILMIRAKPVEYAIGKKGFRVSSWSFLQEFSPSLC